MIIQLYRVQHRSFTCGLTWTGKKNTFNSTFIPFTPPNNFLDSLLTPFLIFFLKRLKWIVEYLFACLCISTAVSGELNCHRVDETVGLTYIMKCRACHQYTSLILRVTFPSDRKWSCKHNVINYSSDWSTDALFITKWIVRLKNNIFNFFLLSVVSTIWEEGET